VLEKFNYDSRLEITIYSATLLRPLSIFSQFFFHAATRTIYGISLEREVVLSQSIATTLYEYNAPPDYLLAVSLMFERSICWITRTPF